MFRQVSRVALVVLAAFGSLTAVTAAEPKPAPTKQITNSIGMKLTLIPSGEFKMGGGESAEATAAFFNKTYGEDLLKADYFKDEHPQHRVRITKPFYLGTYHVTRGQFRQFVADTGYKTDAEKGERPGAFGWDPDKKQFGFNEKYSWRNAGFEQTDEHPVVNVSWNDAVAFCKWLSSKEEQNLPPANRGRVGIRLPCRDDNPLLQRRRSRDAGQDRQRGGRDVQGEIPGHGNTRSKPATAMCSRRQWVHSKPMPSGFTICTGTPGSGARTGTARNTTLRPPQKIQSAQTPAMIVSFVAVPGSTGRPTSVPPFASGARRTSGSATQASALPGLSNSMASGLVTVCPFTCADVSRPPLPRVGGETLLTMFVTNRGCLAGHRI